MTRRFTLLAAALLGLNLFFLLVPVGVAGSGSLAAFLFGPRMMRAEVVMKDGSDYLADRGRISSVAAGSLTLREADGRLVTVQVSPSAQVTLGGVPTTVAALRRGLRATVVRESNGPATIVQAQRR
ncbi:MAG: hypothetical protein ABR569_14960 [Gaiellaceae bacterium]